jgi:hypothetical protein
MQCSNCVYGRCCSERYLGVLVFLWAVIPSSPAAATNTAETVHAMRNILAIRRAVGTQERASYCSFIGDIRIRRRRLREPTFRSRLTNTGRE